MTGPRAVNTVDHWFQTYTGKRFYPFNPRAEDVDVADIAHALSNICRFGGHVKKFLSVAEHCIMVSHLVPREDRLVALLHDATEAYVGDMVRPLKQGFPDYRAVERRIWKCIADKFNVPVKMPDTVKRADNIALVTEAKALHTNKELWDIEAHYQPCDYPVQGWVPAVAEREWAWRFRVLTELIHG